MSISLLVLALGSAHAADQSVLFVGNSYTYFNSPNSIDENYAQLVQEGLPSWEVESQRYARSGANLPGHLSDAEGETDLRRFLTDTETYTWDIVVLQDQSQIPGFAPDHIQWVQSRDAVVSLAEMVAAVGAEPKLFMTWGRRDGDSLNPARYPDFPTMQGHLATGYTAYASAIVEAGHPVEVVPVGMAWQHIYDGHTAVGENPLDSGALFSRLYSGDGSHPSVLGSYLASLVFYAAFTGQSPVGLEWAPDVVTERDRDALQAVAAVVMADAIGPGEDTGDGPADPEDTGTDSDDDDDADGGGTGASTADTASDPVGVAPKDSDGGCGCTTAPGQSPFLIGILMMLVARKRRA